MSSKKKKQGQLPGLPEPDELQKACDRMADIDDEMEKLGVEYDSTKGTITALMQDKNMTSLKASGYEFKIRPGSGPKLSLKKLETVQ